MIVSTRRCSPAIKLSTGTINRLSVQSPPNLFITPSGSGSLFVTFSCLVPMMSRIRVVSQIGDSTVTPSLSEIARLTQQAFFQLWLHVDPCRFKPEQCVRKQLFLFCRGWRRHGKKHGKKKAKPVESSHTLNLAMSQAGPLFLFIHDWHLLTGRW